MQAAVAAITITVATLTDTVTSTKAAVDTAVGGIAEADRKVTPLAGAVVGVPRQVSVDRATSAVAADVVAVAPSAIGARLGAVNSVAARASTVRVFTS